MYIQKYMSIHAFNIIYNIIAYILLTSLSCHTYEYLCVLFIHALFLCIIHALFLVVLFSYSI